MITYTYSLGDHRVGPEYAFDPQSPQITWNGMAGTGQSQDDIFTGTIDAFTEAALHFQELVHDVWVWREQDGGRKTLVFRGPVITPQDNLGADQHTLTLNAESYRYRLTRLNTNLVSNDPVSGNYILGSGSGPTLAWNLIAYHIAAPNDLNGILVNGWSGSGAQVTNAAVPTGTDLASAIDSLAQTAGFEWALVPQDDDTVQFQAWVPNRGVARPDDGLTYLRDAEGKLPGSNVTGTRTVDPSKFGNKVYVVGQDVNGNQLIGFAGTDPGPAGSYTILSDGADLTGGTSATTGVDTQALLNSRAATLRAQAQSVVVGYTLTPTEGWWQGPGQVGVGDQPMTVIKSGRLDVNTSLPVTQITVQPADSAENAQFTLAALPNGKDGRLTVARGFTNIARRLRNSEWRK